MKNNISIATAIALAALSTSANAIVHDHDASVVSSTTKKIQTNSSLVPNNSIKAPVAHSHVSKQVRMHDHHPNHHEEKIVVIKEDVMPMHEAQNHGARNHLHNPRPHHNANVMIQQKSTVYKDAIAPGSSVILGDSTTVLDNNKMAPNDKIVRNKDQSYYKEGVYIRGNLGASFSANSKNNNAKKNDALFYYEAGIGYKLNDTPVRFDVSYGRVQNIRTITFTPVSSVLPVLPSSNLNDIPTTASDAPKYVPVEINVKNNDGTTEIKETIIPSDPNVIRITAEDVAAYTDIQPDPAPAPAPSNFTRKIHSHLAMANLYLDLAHSKQLTPYIALGAGMAFNNVVDKGNSDQSSNNKTDKNFAWSVGGGLTYAIQNNIAIDLSYKYLDTGKQGAKANNNNNKELRNHLISAGLRYSF